MKISIYVPAIAISAALIAIFTAHFGFLSSSTLHVFGIPANLVFWFSIALFVCVLTVVETKNTISSCEDK